MTTMASELDRRTRRRLLAAEGYLELEMFSQALRELQAISEVCETHTAWHLLKAEVLRAQADWHGALEEYRRCHADQPADLNVLMGLAWCYKRIGQLAQAIATMHDAHRVHPEVAVVLYNLSCYYALAERKTQALSWLGRALRMQPELRQLIPAETDFDPIRASPEFRKLLELSA